MADEAQSNLWQGLAEYLKGFGYDISGFDIPFGSEATGSRWEDGYWIPGGNPWDATTYAQNYLNMGGTIQADAARRAANILGDAAFSGMQAKAGQGERSAAFQTWAMFEARARMEEAIQQSLNLQNQATQQAQGQLGQFYNISREDLQPYAKAGEWAIGDLQRLLTEPDYFKASPDYQFTQNEALKGMQQSAAAKGMLQSGTTLKGLADWTRQNASQEYDKVLNRRAAVTSLGLPASQQTAQGALTTGQQMAANTQTGAGRNVQTAMTGGQSIANILQSGAFNVGSDYKYIGDALWEGMLTQGAALGQGELGWGNALASALQASGLLGYNTLMNAWNVYNQQNAQNQQSDNSWIGSLIGGILGLIPGINLNLGGGSKAGSAAGGL